MMMLKGRYSVETPPLDETKLQQELSRSIVITSVEYTRKLAEAKAFSLADRHLADGTSSDTIPTFYLGSDTVVELDDRILEKPKDPEDAKRMLAMMSGRQHHVHTGVAVYRLLANEITLVASFTDTATVTFASLSEETIDDYVATGESLDKAGTFIPAKNQHYAKCSLSPRPRWFFINNVLFT
jgi:predicted house-cleaning NTP pyrophosphatase (Maf/HAM1 superfamily)